MEATGESVRSTVLNWKYELPRCRVEAKWQNIIFRAEEKSFSAAAVAARTLKFEIESRGTARFTPKSERAYARD